MTLAAKLFASAIVAASLFTGTAHAWDGVVQGVISSMHTSTSTGNYEFRVYLRDNGAQWCASTNPGAAGWAALHSTDANYKSTQALLMMASATGRTVHLHLTRDASGYCKIGYVAVNG
jgi:hypothetical protein